jgi:hypothetical protein
MSRKILVLEYLGSKLSTNQIAGLFKWSLLVNRLIFFLKLCMKLEVHKGEKVSESNFWGKFPFCPNWAKMAQKWNFCKYFKFL